MKITLSKRQKYFYEYAQILFDVLCTQKANKRIFVNFFPMCIRKKTF